VTARLGTGKSLTFFIVYYYTVPTSCSTCGIGQPATKFIVPDWGDKADSGIGLSYRPARLHKLAGQYDHPMPESTKSDIPQSGTKNLQPAVLQSMVTTLSAVVLFCINYQVELKKKDNVKNSYSGFLHYQKRFCKATLLNISKYLQSLSEF
jgi:hypothetical protein